MRINNECVRNILFTIEKISNSEHGCHFPNPQYEKLKGYDYDTIQYHLRYLYMKELIYTPMKGNKYSYDLTPAGHEFIANIRDDNNWNKIKGISANIGFASLKVVSAIAEGVATAAINQQLGFSK